MTDEELDRAEAARGTWHYAEGHDELVRIVGLPFDYWYAVAEADGRLEPDEQPQPLGDQGVLYYPYFAQIEGPGLPTIVQAKGFAQSLVKSPIEWS